MQKKVDDVFSGKIDALRQYAGSTAQRLAAGGGTAVPAFNGAGTLDGLLESSIATPFSRDSLNAEYMRVVQEPGNGSHRDLQALKVQMDALSGMERDLRMRYRTRTRMFAHGVARLKSHGLSDGPISRSSLHLVKLLMDARG